MDKAVARIREALRNDELIAVYGDYDADGVTATALLVELLRKLGGRVLPYIPHRLVEGYGLNHEALRKLREEGASLAITVDCGIGSLVEVEYARSLGLDIIVTDHHDVHDELPPAVAVINPKRADSEYPFRSFSGVGVGYKLAQALISSLTGETATEQADQWLDLVALGTVADVVPLLGENRTLVTKGLAVLNSTQRVGIKELVRLAGLPMGALDEGHIGYGICPRINAAGRIDDAIVAYELLTTDSTSEAQRLARILEDRNALRQRLTEAALVKAREAAAEQLSESAVLVIEDGDFSAGIVGLVAAKLVEEYGRPVVVLETGEEYSRGSARSIPQFDIAAALGECSALLLRYGGHAGAAGLAIRTDLVDLFRRRLSAIANRELEGKTVGPMLLVDVELPLNLVTWEMQQNIARLAPFGAGNPEPVLVSRGVRVREKRAVGRDGSHLRLVLQSDGARFNAVGFRMGARVELIPPVVDVAYTVAVNEWNGSRRLELRLRDLQPSGRRFLIQAEGAD